MQLLQFLKSEGISQSEFARRLGVTQGLVWQWLDGRQRVTAENCVLIEAATAGAVTRAELRPDLFLFKSPTRRPESGPDQNDKA